MRKSLKSVHASARRFVFLDGKASWLRRPFWYGYLKNEADNELRYPVLSDFAKGFMMLYRLIEPRLPALI